MGLLVDFFDDLQRTRGNRDPELALEIKSILAVARDGAPDKDVPRIPSKVCRDALSLPELSTLAYILGPEGKNTRIKHILSGTSGNISFISRFPGNVRMMIPVIERLKQEEKVPGVFAITDSQAEEELAKKYPHAQDVTPPLPFPQIFHSFVAGHPKVLVLDTASGDNLSIAMEASFLSYNRPRIVLAHDAHASTERIHRLIENWDLPPVDRVCAIDEWQKTRLEQMFPQLRGRVTVTGQPMFDVRTDPLFIADRKRKIRPQLGITDKDFFLTYTLMAETFNGETEGIAEALAKMKPEFREKLVVAVRRHPMPRRDPLSYDEHVRFFTDRGIRVVHTMDGPTKLPTDDTVAACDGVVNTLSTEGFLATCSGLPAIHIVDDRFGITHRKDIILDVPASEYGAAIKLNRTGYLTNVMETIMTPDSPVARDLATNMKRFYPQDGQKTNRVAAVLLEEMGKAV
ncbi:hypothetical protein A2841_00275 [Candidatus Kaiserbacteria bacterium RIFCSPHIGHO2_01_FULL_48_10]|uniref:UDP-N-acetylglucosamine 2-epimerase domain-containing protein n=1 Tax=Candidatus Kaiserbacteria bacterium RIFCSPHIGHO2_01_FULL_48_10 TaxID=1798476 RepID=A0A1F6C2G4_9BACT|nr:MAG: hypothetical protein A2841_00275 [Candidatus Kaiserbacteria bacterium RIFCSPHIGHO2_01_FULL_48_10]